MTGRTAVHQLATSQRTFAFHGLDLALHNRGILLTPQTHLGAWHDIPGVMEVALFGAHDGPTSLGLDAAHDCYRTLITRAYGLAVMRLIEPISCGDQADLDRFEYNVVLGIPSHEFA